MKRLAKTLGVIFTIIFISRSVSLFALAKYMGAGSNFWSFEPVKLTAYTLAVAVICWGFFAAGRYREVKA